MDELWFEDELSLPDYAVNDISKHFTQSSTDTIETISATLASEARGVVRVFRPDWSPLTSNETKNILHSGRNLSLFKVRLVFEFEIPRENFEKGTRFVAARCQGNIRPVSGAFQPEVYDLFPKDLYEGEPQKVNLKFAPEISLDTVGVSLGEVSTDIAVGQVSPVVVGYFGDRKQEPHWDLRPLNKSLLGRQYFWLVLAMQKECAGIRLFCRAEGDIQTKLGPISIGPKNMVWETRPSILIHK